MPVVQPVKGDEQKVASDQRGEQHQGHDRLPEFSNTGVFPVPEVVLSPKCSGSRHQANQLNSRAPCAVRKPSLRRLSATGWNSSSRVLLDFPRRSALAAPMTGFRPAIGACLRLIANLFCS